MVATIVDEGEAVMEIVAFADADGPVLQEEGVEVVLAEAAMRAFDKGQGHALLRVVKQRKQLAVRVGIHDDNLSFSLGEQFGEKHPGVEKLPE